MLDREPLLKAIFAEPNDDLPRLVFADYLEEQDEAEWAELIRVQCELARREPGGPDRDRRKRLLARERELITRLWPLPFEAQDRPHRGFVLCEQIRADSGDLSDPEAFRRRVLELHPEYYGASSLTVAWGKVTSARQLATILTSPVTERVTRLDLSGHVEEACLSVSGTGDEPGRPVIDLEVRPAITGPIVVLLAQSREARRLTDLDLSNNELDNDTARALARSPHLIRLRRLAFSRGNRFKGRVWQQLVERFGEHVVE
jgi:uncharacterized protein (TIGR02996 family)